LPRTAGTILDQLSYDSYGNILTETNSANGDRFKYTARDWDSEIGLQYNRARYYDPKAGRWISLDPIAFSARDPNLYRYVSNQPARDMDPSGLVKGKDRWFGRNDPKFRRWYHRQFKPKFLPEGGDDASKEEIEEAYEMWKNADFPDADGHVAHYSAYVVSLEVSWTTVVTIAVVAVIIVGGVYIAGPAVLVAVAAV
jgi:RHS repeat-associated protein